MTTNQSGKLNVGGVNAIQEIAGMPPNEWTINQRRYLDACLKALAHQPVRWEWYQDWGNGGPVQFLADRGIEFLPATNKHQSSRQYYEGCGCDQVHWKIKA